MAGMTFLQLQTAVMGTRFDESQRGDVKTWLNATYWRAWTLEEWTFRYATQNVTVTANSKTVSNLPTDLQSVRLLMRGDGEPLTSLQSVDFYRIYNSPRATWTGLPVDYTVLNGSVFVGPASSETATDYLLEYEKEYTALSADADIPALPAGCHEDVLVFGAIARGLKTENDFTWQFFQQTADDGIDVLRRGYLRDRRDTYQSYTADPLGGYS